MNLFSIFSLLLFVPAVVLSFYIPGFVILNLLKVKFEKFEYTLLSLLIGLSFFLLTTYCFAWLSIEKAEYLLLIGFLIVYCNTNKLIFNN